MEASQLNSIHNEQQLVELREWTTHYLDVNFQFSRNFLKGLGWIAVPVESGLHFDENDVERLSAAIRSMGCDQVLAYLLESAKNQSSALYIAGSKAGLQAFNRECAHFAYLLTPKDFSFSIICTKDDYYLVAGPERFVMNALDSSIREARLKFDTFVRNESWSDELKNRLKSVSSLYR